jgi:hypothetical protein
MTATRTPLPERRPSETREIRFDGATYTVSVSYYPDGRPGDVFADGHREGSDMQAMIDDFCIVASIAMQRGATPDELMHSLGRGRWVNGKDDADAWASLVGEIIAAIEPRPELAQIGGRG